MLIGIDIDDTLVNTREKQLIYWADYVTKNPKEGYTKEVPNTINDFGDEYVQVFWDTYREQLSFTPTFKENTSVVLHRLKENNIIPCIITSRPDAKYKNLKLRLKNWLKENNIPIEILYTDVRNKGLFCKENNIDILIDDSLNQIKSAKENNVKAILFNNNPNYEGLQTDNWLDLYDILIKLKEEQN